MAVLVLAQGTKLVASCAVPCRMSADAKLRCVMAGLSERRCALTQVSRDAAGLYSASCGHLDLVAPRSMLFSAKFELSGLSFHKVALLGFLQGGGPEQGLLGVSFTRAGPPSAKSCQALLPQPPQNAPPVLV